MLANIFNFSTRVDLRGLRGFFFYGEAHENSLTFRRIEMLYCFMQFVTKYLCICNYVGIKIFQELCN
jgi:hypothetical protein